MRVRYQKLKGMEVLADKEGRLLGAVRRMLIDSRKRVLLGLAFRGHLMSGERWAKVGAIRRIGEDVLYLDEARSVREDEPEGRDLKDILGLPVSSLDGRRLGGLDDVVVDTDTWTLVSLVLDSGGVVDLGPESVLGEDVVLLRKGAAAEVAAPPLEQPTGFLARVFNSRPPPAEAPAPKKKRRKKPAQPPPEDAGGGAS
ncbi:MAG TPA: PRC-barrel domain-containing protein [Myxococcota bacterium]|nr:PRC-barrel domain-containing protein [Myxococcota bacterium]HRY93420.1 PRC-barrel domain-containing protein [Myxococcota bacterium]HSA21319.1 PRC-barrel domain-containing protein [Myxococcota bacterium]